MKLADKITSAAFALLFACAAYESSKLWEISERVARIEQKLDDHVANKHAQVTVTNVLASSTATLLH